MNKAQLQNILNTYDTNKTFWRRAIDAVFGRGTSRSPFMAAIARFVATLPDEGDLSSAGLEHLKRILMQFPQVSQGPASLVARSAISAALPLMRWETVILPLPPITITLPRTLHIVPILNHHVSPCLGRRVLQEIGFNMGDASAHFRPFYSKIGQALEFSMQFKRFISVDLSEAECALALQFLEQNSIRSERISGDLASLNAEFAAYLEEALARLAGRDAHFFARLALAVAEELDPTSSTESTEVDERFSKRIALQERLRATEADVNEVQNQALDILAAIPCQLLSAIHARSLRASSSERSEGGVVESSSQVICGYKAT